MMNYIWNKMRQFRRSGKHQGRFLIYFMIVNLVAAGTVGILLYISTTGTIRQQMTEENQNMLLQISRSTDMLLNQVITYIDQIPNDPDILDLPEYMKTNGVLSLVDINNKMSNIMDNNSYIYDIAIYYINEKKVFVVNDGVIELKDYDYRDIILSNMQYPLTKMVPSFKIPDKNYPGRFTNVISVIKPVQIYGMKPDAYVLVLIEDRFFRDMMNSILDSNNVEIYITNDDGDTVSKNDEGGRYAGLMNKDFIKALSAEAVENRVVAYNKEKVLVSSVSSRIYGWKYISVVSYESVNGKTRIVKNYSIVVSLLAILLGVFASLFFLKRISSPINKIIRLFNNGNMTDDKDIFGYIEKNVITLVQNKENMEKMLSDHIPVLRNNYLAGILLGQITNPEEIENRFAYYGIELEIDGDYIVYVISLGSYGSLSGRYTEKQINMLIVYLMGVVNELINMENQGLVINTRPNEIAVVLKLPESICKEEMKQKVNSLGTQIRKCILGKITCIMGIAVGTVYRGINQVFLSYEEAVEALEYRAFINGDDIIFYGDVKNMKEEKYSYPFLKEKELFNSLRQGNEDEISERNKSIFKAFACCGKANQSVVHYMQLLNSTIRFAYETGINLGNELDENKLYSEILSCNTIPEAQAWFENVFERIIKVIGNRNDSRNRSIIASVESYISGNYEKELSLTALADMVHMSVNNFRKIFKDETGKPFKQYVNEVRMEKAKELLRNPQYKISDVAEAVGYEKANAFLYIFRESTGMTPGEYRSTVLHLY